MVGPFVLALPQVWPPCNLTASKQFEWILVVFSTFLFISSFPILDLRNSDKFLVVSLFVALWAAALALMVAPWAATNKLSFIIMVDGGSMCHIVPLTLSPQVICGDAH